LETGVLYVVATPIGNMEDITLRAIRILEEVDLVAAEDTRRTHRLLKHLDIKTKMISFHEHSGKTKEDKIIESLLFGESVALVSDAGTPLISDPGADLVSRAVDEGIKVIPIPGACAAIAALSASGIFEGSFLFEGFLPTKSKDRKKAIEGIKAQAKTIVLYEAPHRIIRTLNDLKSSLGEKRRIVIGREITKIYEEFIRGSIGEVLEKLESKEVKGEIVIIISAEEKRKVEVSDEEIIRFLKAEMKKGATKKDAVIKTASSLNVCKNRVYKLSLNH